jgi:hypothetical protein
MSFEMLDELLEFPELLAPAATMPAKFFSSLLG